MPDVTAQCFSQYQPLEVVTPFPEGSYTEWHPLAEVLNEHLGDLLPGAVRYRLIENVTLAGDTLPAEMPLPVEIQWRVALFRRGSPILTHFNCTALLIREDKELAAIRLLAVYPTPEPPAPLEEMEAHPMAELPQSEAPQGDLTAPPDSPVEHPLPQQEDAPQMPDQNESHPPDAPE